uniref:Uncharacterized protein n=1 Tax=Megaselia scalaris TaxID=36166 RepID=T1GTS5_MEGSC
MKIYLKKFFSIKISKNLWTYVAHAFNQVDHQRLECVGPDRLCAEWVLKNGGAVEFFEIKGFLKDYNLLPPEEIQLSVKTIDASNSSIMKIGFEHLIGCRKLDKIILHNCKHLEDDGLYDFGTSVISHSMSEGMLKGSQF